VRHVRQPLPSHLAQSPVPSQKGQRRDVLGVVHHPLPHRIVRRSPAGEIPMSAKDRLDEFYLLADVPAQYGGKKTRRGARPRQLVSACGLTVV
jgi:hypothetical protein